MNELYEEIRRMPKYELHRHLDGSLTGKDAYRIGVETGIVNSGTTEEDFIKNTTIRKEDDIPTLLSKFNQIIAVMRTGEGLQKSFEYEAKRLAEENIIYAELRFAPLYHSILDRPRNYPITEAEFVKSRNNHAETQLTLQEVMEHALNGAKKGSREYNTQIGVLFCINREANPALSKYLVEELTESNLHKHTNFAGIDEACNEFAYPTGRHREAFQLAKSYGVKCTSHSGEMGENRAENIRRAIEQGVNRIGHAIDLWKDKDLIRTIIDKGIGIESCPGSYLFTGLIKEITDIKLDVLLEEGVKVSLSSDDPRFMPSLSEGYYEVAQAHGFTIDELKQFKENAMKTRFIK